MANRPTRSPHNIGQLNKLNNMNKSILPGKVMWAAINHHSIILSAHIIMNKTDSTLTQLIFSGDWWLKEGNYKSVSYMLNLETTVSWNKTVHLRRFDKHSFDTERAQKSWKNHFNVIMAEWRRLKDCIVDNESSFIHQLHFWWLYEDDLKNVSSMLSQKRLEWKSSCLAVELQRLFQLGSF